MPQDLDELARQVHDAFQAGRCSMIELASEDPAEPFQGTEGQCHANAKAWCERHPGFAVEEGYFRGQGKRVAGSACPHAAVLAIGAGRGVVSQLELRLIASTRLIRRQTRIVPNLEKLRKGGRKPT